ncbi:MAG TPA: tRNA (adenosine(37)-N6)-threonylcarbamoyltransferase complex ATPase subunit type 1 TsaE [Candidatus Paceibacterota bacterium]|nr:tRNA (adenosine(37)-N6)-threonylcarbamoyltransferase complex ATPase subunit type 1 TsaE [Candidatus Paceibacterota bacterium]
MRRLATLEELHAEATALAARLTPRSDRATLVTLSGELGAGKTSLTQALARAYGIEEHVTSPTFVLEKIYRLPEGKPFAHLVHIDAYRLKGGAELAPLGFDELMKDSGTLVVLEWPELVADGLPVADVSIQLSVQPDETRLMTYG